MPKLPVVNLAGKEVKALDLPDEVFGTPVKEELIQEAVVAFRAAGRSGTHATKNRSDVKGGALLVDEPGNRHLELSARNLPRVKATLSTALNIVDLLFYDTVVLTEAAASRVAEVLRP